MNTSPLEREIARRLEEYGFTVGPGSAMEESGQFRSHLSFARGAGERREVEVLSGAADLGARMFRMLGQRAGDRSTWVLGADHLTRGDAERLRRLGVQFIDSGGNAWLESPELLIWVEGRKPQVVPRADRDRPSRAFSRSGLRALFVLLVDPKAAEEPMRDIAMASGVSLGTVSSAVKDLIQGGLAARAGGRLVLTDRQRAIDRWVEHYISDLRPTLKEIRLDAPDPTLRPEGIVAKALATARAQVTGETALARMGFGLSPAMTELVIEGEWGPLVRQLRAAPSPDGTLVLREKFWSGGLGGDSSLAPALLVYADCMASGDPRVMEVAREMRAGGALDG